MMEAVQTSETLVHLYQSTGRYNPEDSHLLPVLNCLLLVYKRLILAGGYVINAYPSMIDCKILVCLVLTVRKSEFV
jgi:hypothetical protein